MKLKYFLIFFFVFLISAFASVLYVFFTNPYEPAKTNYTPKDTEVLVEPETDISTPQVVETNTPLIFMMPVDSDSIGMNFSPTELIYSKTLDEWTTHNGIDILAKCSTPVKAIEAGTVEEITSDNTYGIKITISHKDGYKSVYANLSTTKMVNLGQTITKGQVISGIGNTSTFEISEPEHLHFELYKDDIAIDPLLTIKS